jgi:hypothetical protein
MRNKIIIGAVILSALAAIRFYVYQGNENLGATPILTVSQGGTGMSSATDNYVVVGKDTLHFEAVATGTLGILPPNGTAYGQLLLYDGSNWSYVATSTLGLEAVVTLDQLGQIGDVTTSTPMTTGDVLVWNVNHWESTASTNLTVTGGSGSGTISTSSSLTAGLLVQSTAWNTIANIATSSLGLPTLTDLSNYVSTSDWTTQESYPSGCGLGEYVSAIGDTLTCSSPVGGGTVNAGNTWQSPYYSENGTVLSATSTITYADNETLTLGTGLEVMRITDSKVGIGTSTPYSKFTVWGTGPIFNVSNTASTSLLTVTNTGAFVSGIWDFGGADSFEIPNSSNPTVDTLGEIALDTTSDQLAFYGGAKRIIPYWQEKCFTVASTTFEKYDNIPLWHPSKAVEITDVYCETDGGTSVAVVLGDGTNSLESITCDEDGAADDGSIANGTFTVNERLETDFGTVTGSVNWLNVCITYNITSD